jgi:NTP pyrophosphatase (non-canonical NTP hydrolase)
MKIETWEDYKKEAFKTWNPAINGNDALEYIQNKIIEELGELLGAFTKEKFHGKEGNYIEELGDIYWYLANYENLFTDIRKNAFENYLDDPESRHGNLQYMLKASIRYTIEFATPEFALELADYICLNMNFKKVLIWSENIKKLRKRHGETYNSKHYKDC